ncbi:MAG: heme ABC transporter ATP-binding protein [Rhodospirillales bacterium]
MLEARDLEVRIGRARLLQAVEMTLRPGRLLAVLGPNGAGKSTLLKCLSGALQPTCGQVLLEGRALEDWPRKALARRRAVLPQEPPCGGFGLRACDLVALGRSPHLGDLEAQSDALVVAAALRSTGAGHLAERDLSGLSGGELQRVDLARVLAQIWEARAPRPPGYLLLDEPTASLDLVQQGRILGLARDFAERGYGVLAIVHDLTAALRLADEALLLDGGRVVAFGPVEEVMQAETLSAAFGAPLQVAEVRGSRQRAVLTADG